MELTVGFELEETHYVLNFEDPKYAGLVVKMREVSIGDLCDLAGVEDEFTPAVMEPLFKMLADGIVEWNLEKGGEPVPTTYEAVRRQPSSFVMDILRAWEFAAVGVSAPLGEGSTSGKPPQELGLGTAA